MGHTTNRQLTGGISLQVKQPATHQQQIEYLRDKGLVIRNEKACIAFLNRVNYYRLLAYLEPFRGLPGHKADGVAFERIMGVYEFDRDLRGFLFSVIEEVELYLRNGISHYHAFRYGPLGYLQGGNFAPAHRHKTFLRLLDDVVEDNRTDAVILHHMKKYEGKFPIWVVIEYFSIGMLEYFYADLLENDKKQIAWDLYRVDADVLEDRFHSLTELRNRCAHYARLYARRFEAVPPLPEHLKRVGYSPSDTLWDQLLSLKLLHDMVKAKHNFQSQFISLIKEYEDDIVLSHMGIPNNWEEVLNFCHL